MSTSNSLRRGVPIWDVDELRKARKDILQRLSDTELSALVAAWSKTAKRTRRDDCCKYILKALDDTVEDSLRENVNSAQELQGSRCKQMLDVLISVGDYEKKFRDGLLGE
ncbi:hypothetical protein MAP00_005383 [Monascus purpureus]|nr:hypothetical protein MAP00_005383 [Monascus purpureus]